MLVLDSTRLSPTVGDYAAPIAQLHSANSTNPLPVLRLGRAPAQTPIFVTVPGSDPIDAPFSISVPPGTQRVEQLSIGGSTYVLTSTPNSPQPGEFVFYPFTGILQVYPRGIIMPGTSVRLIGADTLEVIQDVPITDIRLLPDIFVRFELMGTVDWSCSWEGHPSGSFKLLCKKTEIETIRQQLIPKRTAIQMFGIGFEVDSMEIEWEAPPSDEAVISVSLRGKWERYMEEQVLLAPARASGFQFSVRFETGDGGNTTSFSSTVTRPTAVSFKPKTGRTIYGNTTIQEIALLCGAKVIAPSMPIRAPRQVGNEQTIGLSEAFTGNLRHRRLFARYSDQNAIRAENLDKVPLHVVYQADILDADSLKFQVQAYPRAQDYKNHRLEWGSSIPEQSTFLEDTQGAAKLNLRPQWRQKPPKREISITGSADATVPPSDIESLDEGLSVDNGGPTKEVVTVITEDGTTVEETRAKYAMPLVAVDDLYVKAGNKWEKSDTTAGEMWQPTELAITQFFYNQQTGYLSEKQTNGYYSGRLKGDGGNESLKADEDDLDLFRFDRIPMQEISLYSTRLFRYHYADVPEQPTEEWEENVPEFSDDETRRFVGVFGGEGSYISGRTEINGKPYLTITHKLPVPGSTDPAFCDREGRRKLSFKSAPDPDSTDEAPKPDLTTGQDEIGENMTEVPDFREQVKRDPSGAAIAEYFFEHSRVTKVQDAGMRLGARQLNLTQNKGRPSEHTRKVPQYEKIDPNERIPEPVPYRYAISTIDYPDARIEGGSVSYPYARNLAEALIGAKTDLEINNGRDTETISIKIGYRPEIREGHLVNLEGFGLWWVLSYNNSLNIPAPGIAEPADGTSLTLGRKIQVPEIQVERLRVPQPPKSTLGERPKEGGTGSRLTSSFEIGKLVLGPSRGNPNGR